ncbi:MAG TPA: TetR/AcrR family transcriptional regulator C-terminal domain-containing protein [Microlunatus sp.]
MSDASWAAVLWSEPAVGRRGPKPRVDRSQIVAAAIEIADREGIAAASMQRIAAEIGVTKMALYRHLPGRTELLSLMIEAAMGPAPDTSGSWRDGLRAWADAMRIGFTEHRWMSAAAAGARPIGPVELGWTEAGLAPMAELPLRGSERLDTLVLISSHVRGIVQQLGGDDPERAISGPLTEIVGDRAADFPLSVAAFAESVAADATDQAYEYGLERILDGVAALIAER